MTHQRRIGVALIGLCLAVGCETTKRFAIRSIPEGARVVVDNQPLPGKTPLDHAFSFSSQGDRHETHLIRVLKDGYYEDSWEIQHADAPHLIFFLVKKPSQ